MHKYYLRLTIHLGVRSKSRAIIGVLCVFRKVPLQFGADFPITFFYQRKCGFLDILSRRPIYLERKRSRWNTGGLDALGTARKCGSCQDVQQVTLHRVAGALYVNPECTKRAVSVFPAGR